MNTYADIFKLLRNGGISFWLVNSVYNFPQVWKMIAILCRAEIAMYDTVKHRYVLHPKQIKPAISVVEIPPKTAPSSDLGRVHVDWSGRGHSSGSYAVTADKGKFLEIEFELDVRRVMTVAKERTRAA